jgi:hypothetical protein
MRNRLNYSSADFSFGQRLFRRRPFIGQVKSRRCHGISVVVFREWCGYLPLPEQHQRFIDSYAGDPGGKGRVFAKSAEICENALKRTLNCIFRILSIAKYPEGSVIDPKSMTVVQFSESGRAPRFRLRY